MVGWPRGMKEDVAASYVGLSPSAFLRAVGAGKLPQPEWITRGRRIWLKDDLDDFLDRLFKRSSNAEADRWIEAARRETGSPVSLGSEDQR